MKVHYRAKTFEIWGYYPDNYEGIAEPNIEVSDDAYKKALEIGATHVNLKTNELYAKEQASRILSKDEILELKKIEFISCVDKALNNKAKEHGYDNILTAVSYRDSATFGEESEAFFNWRDAVYSWGYTLLEKAKKGELNLGVSFEELSHDMPKFSDFYGGRE